MREVAGSHPIFVSKPAEFSEFIRQAALQRLFRLQRRWAPTSGSNQHHVATKAVPEQGNSSNSVKCGNRDAQCVSGHPKPASDGHFDQAS